VQHESQSNVPLADAQFTTLPAGDRHADIAFREAVL